MQNGKSGRRISAKNKERLEQAIAHYESAIRCVRDALDGDASDEESALWLEQLLGWSHALH